MASIDKRSDGRYRARWREYPGGPQRTRQFRRKGDAERFLDTVRGDLARGVYIDPNDGRTALRRLRRDVAGRAAPPAVDGRPARDVPPRARLPDARAPPTRGDPPQRHPGLGQGAVRGAGTRLGRARLPVGGDDLQGGRGRPAHRRRRRASASLCRRRTATDIVPLPVDAVERLVATMPERYRALIVLAAGAGLRQGECFGVTVDRIDFLRRELRVDRQLVAVATVSRTSGHPRLRPASARCRCR